MLLRKLVMMRPWDLELRYQLGAAMWTHRRDYLYLVPAGIGIVLLLGLATARYMLMLDHPEHVADVVSCLDEARFGIVTSNITDANGAPFEKTVPHAVVPVKTRDDGLAQLAGVLAMLPLLLVIIYLFRDSLHAGVPYGRHFDQQRLLVASGEKAIVLKPLPGLSAAW